MERLIEFAPHELLECHEILSAEITAALKLQNALTVVKDPDLFAFMSSSLRKKQQHIENIENLLRLS